MGGGEDGLGGFDVVEVAASGVFPGADDDLSLDGGDLLVVGVENVPDGG